MRIVLEARETGDPPTPGSRTLQYATDEGRRRVPVPLDAPKGTRIQRHPSPASSILRALACEFAGCRVRDTRRDERAPVLVCYGS